jgi:hypothetical protein
MIPTQLKNMKFCRVKKGTKEPFETAWQNNPYTYEQIQQYFPKDNYGVLTGHNNLGVLDDDSKDKFLIIMFLERFGKTFRVRDHLYIILNGWDKKKIIFYDTDGKKLGELQGLGQQVVGAGSLHPSGCLYEVANDIPIIELNFSDFYKHFEKYIIKKEDVVREFKRTDWQGDKIQDMSIRSITSFSGSDMGDGCYQGSHPKHGSIGGMNFRINTKDNTWYCFRCSAGGGSAELIAVMEGIIPCSQAGRKCFTKEQALEVIKVAREKYGLKDPTADYKPKGWANSVSIVKLAEKHNFKVCPKCHQSFNFNDRLGWFKCRCMKGGLKQFAELITQGVII